MKVISETCLERRREVKPETPKLIARRSLLGGLLAAAAMLTPALAEARRRGCGARGGPGGKRKANGKCPSWKD